MFVAAIDSLLYRELAPSDKLNVSNVKMFNYILLL